MTPLVKNIIVFLSDVYAISKNISSSEIYNFTKFIWYLTAFVKFISFVGIKAPPFFRVFAASGTNNTLKPIWVNIKVSSVKAVVLPAHGPPVRQILVMVFLFSVYEILYSELAWLEIISSSFSLGHSCLNLRWIWILFI